MRETVYGEGEVIRRARQATWLAAVLAVVSTLATIVRPLVAEMPPIFSIIGAANSLFLASAWWAMRSGWVVAWAPGLLLGLVTFSLLPLITISGGPNSQFVTMLPLFPLAGVMLGGRRLGLALLLFWSVAILSLRAGHKLVPDLTGEGFESAKANARTLWLILTSIVGFLFGLHFDGSTRRLQAQLVDLVERDPLTGVANRRGLDLGLSRSLSSAARLDQRVTVMMVDVDFFKRFNDHRGHAEGDLALQRIAASLTGHCRHGQDQVARLGGEEFVVVLGDTDADAARVVAEKLRHAVRALDLRFDPGMDEPLTVTIGYVCVQGRLEVTHDELLRAADSALYEGKRRGRDRSVLALLREGPDSRVSLV